MKNLIGMTYFVLDHGNPSNTDSQFADKVMAYANFLKQPLELWMFVPCDEDGDVLEKPINNSRELDSTFLDKNLQRKFDFAFLAYQQAKERCYFDDYSLEYSESLVEYWKKIEDLVQYNLRLTPTALKQIGV